MVNVQALKADPKSSRKQIDVLFLKGWVLHSETASVTEPEGMFA
jgi:hypothetical protein